ncbi:MULTISPECIES: hypothetical protein [Shewanella]|uniref:hypothetical protein n=1 Tax=Shewanella TaxID=22 RepID=UPI000D129ED6|nr:hypothetical protein [Shewanella algae]PSS68706.1 hypothetical protein AYI85_12565 [Shewanella algae]TVL02123.1 hypothetical protein AYI84_13825 [Shewanella algae]TVL53330.1 hypothetical protein AYI99_07075 [Shewanella algae]TWO84629.1 hypothetical protein AYI75_08820 [Shewanella algae]
MSPQNNPVSGEKLIVRRGLVDSVDLYEVKENELELLEKGSPAGLQLNFSVFLLSIAFSAILTLATATVKWPIMETVFVVVAVIGILLGIYLLISWWKTRTSIANIISVIRDRIPPEAAVSEPAASAKNTPLNDKQSPAG